MLRATGRYLERLCCYRAGLPNYFSDIRKYRECVKNLSLRVAAVNTSLFLRLGSLCLLTRLLFHKSGRMLPPKPNPADPHSPPSSASNVETTVRFEHIEEVFFRKSSGLVLDTSLGSVSIAPVDLWRRIADITKHSLTLNVS
jgi:hypothetical protein